MAKLDLALVVRTVDKATAPLRRIQKSVRDLTRRTGLDRVGRGIRSVGRGLRSAGEAAGRFAKNAGLVAGALGALIGLPALKAFASLESLETSFESMLGSAEAAAEMVKRLTEFSAKTPFQIAGIGRATKSLLAFGVEGDDIVGKLEFLGDIAAGAGVPLADLAQIYGKSMAKGKAQTEELNQMSERGVPILTALVDLAATYGNEISKEDVYKAAERGEIKFKAIEEAMKLMTAEGGIFNQQMQRQSETMSGLASTVKDNLFLAVAELGKKMEETFGVKQNMRDLIVWLQELTAAFQKPREEQEGFARAVTETFRALKALFVGLDKIFDDIADAIAAVHSAWKDFTGFFDSSTPKINAALYGDLGSPGGDGGVKASTAGFARRRSRVPRSLFDTSDAAGGGGGAGGREVIVLPDIVVESPRPPQGNAQIKVDFTNMPRGTSTETRADDDVDLEVTTGFAMQGAQ